MPLFCILGSCIYVRGNYSYRRWCHRTFAWYSRPVQYLAFNASNPPILHMLFYTTLHTHAHTCRLPRTTRLERSPDTTRRLFCSSGLRGGHGRTRVRTRLARHTPGCLVLYVASRRCSLVAPREQTWRVCVGACRRHGPLCGTCLQRHGLLHLLPSLTMGGWTGQGATYSLDIRLPVSVQTGWGSGREGRNSLSPVSVTPLGI